MRAAARRGGAAAAAAWRRRHSPGARASSRGQTGRASQHVLVDGDSVAGMTSSSRGGDSARLRLLLFSLFLFLFARRRRGQSLYHRQAFKRHVKFAPAGASRRRGRSWK